MSESVPLGSLVDWLAEELAREAGSTAVLAGHFALYSAGATALDLLDADPPPRIAADMLAFTALTWYAACDALARSGNAHARLLVLADDIQYVRPALDDRAAGERLGAALAAGYLRAHRALPPWHDRVLRDSGLSGERVLRQRENRWLFSERELRIAAVTALRERARASDANALGLVASANASRIDVTRPGRDAYCIVQSGRTNCAGGYLELVAEVRRRGVERLIALVPYRCLGPVSLGAALAQRLTVGTSLSVVTVAIPDAATGLAAPVLRDADLWVS